MCSLALIGSLLLAAAAEAQPTGTETSGADAQAQAVGTAVGTEGTAAGTEGTAAGTEGTAEGKAGTAVGTEQREAEAELLWRKAQQWLGGKDEAAGRLLVADVARDYPETLYGREAAKWLEENRGLDHSGRTELIVGATLNGTLLGFSVSAGLGDYWPRYRGEVLAWSAVGGALAGLSASAIVSGYVNVSDSQAWLFDFAGMWGWWNGLVIYDLLYPLDDADSMLAAAAGLSAGTAATLALWPHLDVDEGAASMATWMGIYTFEVALLSNYAIGGERVFRDDETAALLGLLVPSNLAVAGGYVAGKELRWTSDDVTFIALGGFLGNLVGAALIATVDRLQDSVQPAMATLLVSTIASLGVSTVIVRPWRHAGLESRRDPLPAWAGLLHVDENGTHVSTPAPTLVPVSWRGETGLGVEVPILSIGY